VEGAAMSDFYLSNHGALIGVRPVSEAASVWVAAHIPANVLWLGNMLVATPSYVGLFMHAWDVEGLGYNQPSAPRTYNCFRCRDGEMSCVYGDPFRCDWGKAQND